MIFHGHENVFDGGKQDSCENHFVNHSIWLSNT